MKFLRALVLLLAAVLVPAFAFAQEPRQDLLTASSSADDLPWPTSPSSLGIFATPKLAIYKPEGDGPFPALVLMHQCGGLRSRNWQNRSMLDWARRAVEQGYVALLVDSLGPRNVESVCERSTGGVNFPRGAKDAYQAARHLASLPYVDPSRLAIAGFSWGAMVTLLATNPTWQQTFGATVRFAAAVSFYPGCSGSPTLNDMFIGEVGTPLLVLMGGQDNETPPSSCIPRLQDVQRAGRPVEWHLYPDASHCWDCENLNGFTKPVQNGTVTYRGFLARNLGKR
jgi:dienelactone hydrolase